MTDRPGRWGRQRGSRSRNGGLPADNASAVPAVPPADPAVIGSIGDPRSPDRELDYLNRLVPALEQLLSVVSKRREEVREIQTGVRPDTFRAEDFREMIDLVYKRDHALTSGGRSAQLIESLYISELMSMQGVNEEAARRAYVAVRAYQKMYEYLMAAAGDLTDEQYDELIDIAQSVAGDRAFSHADIAYLHTTATTAVVTTAATRKADGT